MIAFQEEKEMCIKGACEGKVQPDSGGGRSTSYKGGNGAFLLLSSTNIYGATT